MSILKVILRRLVGLVCAAALTLALFLVLPLMQAIGGKQQDTVLVQQVDVIQEGPPPDAEEEEEPPPDPVEEQEPPELETEPLVADISQLDLALGTGAGFALPGADTTINIGGIVEKQDNLSDMFDLDELDSPPRVLSQASPRMTDQLRSKTPATVIVVFIVDERGRVQNATVQSSSDPVFDRAAISAVNQWRFEPGKSKGRPVESRMRIPITFPKE